VGASRVWERWQHVFGAVSNAVVSNHTPGFADVDSLPTIAPASVIGPAVVVRSTVAPMRRLLLPGAAADLPRGFAVDGQTVAWTVKAGEGWPGPIELADAEPLRNVVRLGGTVDLLAASERLLEDDCTAFLDGPGDGVPTGVTVLGNPDWVVVRGASVEPQVVFDVRKGPIVLDHDAVVRAGTRLEGPLFVGPHSWILGGAVRHSSIGPHCRVHGEVGSCVFIGYSNKAHDGFLGDSVVGQWVNLGAGTITSNLKNTYGEIRLDVEGRRIATGRSKVGTLFGDHVKTAIGTMLGTGTILGSGANVFGGAVPRYVAPFACGVTGGRIDADRFVAVARRVMPRRGVEVTPEIEASLRAVHARCLA
jgi:UDP-N-acetylglucosamine diphosphorylase/glucosamine-1-phosphate N-acetyltransferase